MNSTEETLLERVITAAALLKGKQRLASPLKTIIQGCHFSKGQYVTCIDGKQCMHALALRLDQGSVSAGKN